MKASNLVSIVLASTISLTIFNLVAYLMINLK